MVVNKFVCALKKSFPALCFWTTGVLNLIRMWRKVKLCAARLSNVWTRTSFLESELRSSEKPFSTRRDDYFDDMSAKQSQNGYQPEFLWCICKSWRFNHQFSRIKRLSEGFSADQLWVCIAEIKRNSVKHVGIIIESLQRVSP